MIKGYLEEYSFDNDKYPADLNPANFPQADTSVFIPPSGIQYVYIPDSPSNAQHYILRATQTSNGAVIKEVKSLN